MAGDTLVKRAILQIAAQDGDTEAVIEKIKAKAEELGKLHPEIRARINQAAVSAQVGVIRAELKDLSKPVDIDIDPAKARIDELELKLRRLRLEKQNIKIGADATPAEIRIAELEAEISAAGTKSGGLFSGGFSATGYLWTAGITAALAALPAVAASGGAAAGIALGAALLIGTQHVKGPLYDSFHQLTTGLMQVLRISALPLVQPLREAFAQVGQWAKTMYPVLRQVFGSLGPLVMPFAKGIEGLVQGVLPGFLALMRAAQPAVQAVGRMLSQLGQSLGGTLGALTAGVKGSSQFLSGLSGIIANLLPVVAELADMLAQSLGPVLQSVGQQLMPVLAGALIKILQAAMPLIPPLAGITAQLITLGANVLNLLAGPLAGLASNLLGLATKVLPTLIGPINTVIGWLNGLADAANRVLGFLSHIPGLGWLAPASSAAAGFGDPVMVSGPVTTSLAQAAAAETAAGFGSWASGAFGTPATGGSSGPTVAQQTAAYGIGQKITAALGSGVRATIPQARASARTLMSDIHKELAAGAITAAQSASLINQVQKALQSHIATVKADARKLGESLTVSLADSIASSNSASSMKTAVGKLLADVKTAYDDGILTLKQDRALTTWLDGEAIVLEGIASKRAHIVSEIASARQLAASTASSISGGYGLSNFASAGPNGEPMNVSMIIRTLRGDVIQARQFGQNIKKLAREGLPKSYLMQLIQMGPIQGGPLAQELAQAALGDIKTISTYENQISEVSGGLGKMAANIQFEGGKAASKGFLLELEKQKQALDKAGQRIAQAMVKELRHDLGPGGAAAGNKLEIRLVGGDREFRIWLKKIIRITGGNVEVIGA